MGFANAGFMRSDDEFGFVQVWMARRPSMFVETVVSGATDVEQRLECLKRFSENGDDPILGGDIVEILSTCPGRCSDFSGKSALQG